MTDASGAIAAQYGYGPWGEVTKIQGVGDSDFQYAGYYIHSRSGLGLTRYRAYNANLGVWLSRDPSDDEEDEPNRYRYVANNPIKFNDPLGLFPGIPGPPPIPNPSSGGGHIIGPAGSPPPNDEPNDNEVYNHPAYLNCLAGVHNLFDSIQAQYEKEEADDFKKAGKNKKKLKCARDKWRKKWQDFNDDQASRSADCFTKAKMIMRRERGSR